METSIIIPTYNRRDILERTLRALFTQTYPRNTYEIIIVDDGSTDGTEGMIKGLSAPCVLRYFRQDKKGPAAARNYGLREAKGEIIIFIDSDVLVNSHFIQEHLRYHQKYHGIVVRGLVINTPDIKNLAEKKMKLTDISTAFFATGNVSVRKSYLVKVGPFNENFKEYGWEDLEMGERLKELDLKVRTNKKALGYHYQKKLYLADLPKICAKEEARGRTAVIFYKKHPTFSVKCMTQISFPFFFLDRLLTIGNWINANWGRKLLFYLEKQEHYLLLNFFMKIISQHSYMDGIREALKKSSEGRELDK